MEVINKYIDRDSCTIINDYLIDNSKYDKVISQIESIISLFILFRDIKGSKKNEKLISTVRPSSFKHMARNVINNA